MGEEGGERDGGEGEEDGEVGCCWEGGRGGCRDGRGGRGGGGDGGGVGGEEH